MSFFALHSGLPREGPGNDASTEQALHLLANIAPKPDILDIGCGPGAQTLVLARVTNGTITAVDRHQPFLEELKRRANAAGLVKRINAVNASMTGLPFQPESFDVIWSEGAIWVMGFEQGLNAWHPFVRKNGYVVVSEPTWLSENPPEAPRKFWAEAYPAMRTLSENRAVIERCNYNHIADFALPKAAWLTDYYEPLERRIADLKQRHANDRTVLQWLAREQREIDLFHEHGDSYAYIFYAMQRR